MLLTHNDDALLANVSLLKTMHMQTLLQTITRPVQLYSECAVCTIQNTSSSALSDIKNESAARVFYIW